jgi:hypothetical protein
VSVDTVAEDALRLVLTDELNELCRDRPLVTPEIHTPNDFYGHATLLKRYAALPPRPPLKAVIEHGPFIDDFMWDHDARSALPLVLCSSDHRVQRHTGLRHGARRAVAIGPLTAYVTADARSRPSDGRRRLVAFPAHSTHHVEARYEVDAFSEALARTPGHWDEIWVCLYWRDVLRGLAGAFRERGFSVVSAGHMYDRQFLHRLVSILSAAELVVTNEMGSHVLYAVHEGRPVWIVSDEVTYVADRSTLSRDHSASPEYQRQQLRAVELFREPVEEPTSAQREFAAEMLTPEAIRSPDEMRAVLEEAEELYRDSSPLRRRVEHRLYSWARWRGHALRRSIRELSETGRR